MKRCSCTHACMFIFVDDFLWTVFDMFWDHFVKEWGFKLCVCVCIHKIIHTWIQYKHTYIQMDIFSFWCISWVQNAGIEQPDDGFGRHSSKQETAERQAVLRDFEGTVYPTCFACVSWLSMHTCVETGCFAWFWRYWSIDTFHMCVVPIHTNICGNRQSCVIWKMICEHISLV